MRNLTKLYAVLEIGNGAAKGHEGSFSPYYSMHPIGGLHFASAERVRSQIVSLKNRKHLDRLENLTVIPDGVIMNGTAEHRVGSNILVIHCDALCRLDYTFLQSFKMLVQEWSRNGRVVWCDASPLIKEQLKSVIQEPLYCDTEGLGVFIIEITMATQTGNTSDTRL